MEAGSGHIVNTASLAGLSAAPAITAYSAAKHAVVGLSKAARAELRVHNIGVSVLCPGLIRTNIIATSRIRFREDDGFSHESFAGFMGKWGIPPERAARAVLRAIRKDRPVVVVGGHAKAAWYLERFSVSLTDALMGRAYAAIGGRARGTRNT